MKTKILMSACPILFFSLWLSVAAVLFGLADSAASLEAEESTQFVQACQPLPPPSGTIVNVSTVSELQNAVNNATSGDTILVADDIDGDGRSTDAAPDIGADEYASASTWNVNKPLIIDHTCTDISKIPPYWLEQAKRLTIHYAHTSHGSQVNSGILNLESLDSTTYSVAIRTSTTAGLPPEEDPPALRMYDGNPPETYISPGDYWDGTSGFGSMRLVQLRPFQVAKLQPESRGFLVDDGEACRMESIWR